MTARYPLDQAMETRRRFLTQSALALTGIAGAGAVLGDTNPERTPDGSQAKDMITPAAQRCIDQGLEFLARGQQPDGSFNDPNGQYKGNVAVTSLAGLAMMAGGHQPGRGTYGKVVTNALQYVLGKEDPRKPGFFHNPQAHTHGPTRLYDWRQFEECEVLRAYY